MGGLVAEITWVSLNMETTYSVGILTPLLRSVAKTMMWPAATMDSYKRESLGQVALCKAISMQPRMRPSTPTTIIRTSCLVTQASSNSMVMVKRYSRSEVAASARNRLSILDSCVLVAKLLVSLEHQASRSLVAS